MIELISVCHCKHDLKVKWQSCQCFWNDLCSVKSRFWSAIVILVKERHVTGHFEKEKRKGTHQGPNILRSSRITQNPWGWAFALFSVKSFAKWLDYLELRYIFKQFSQCASLFWKQKPCHKRTVALSKDVHNLWMEIPPAFADIISSWLAE